MKNLQNYIGKISIHEPLTLDKDNPGNIFERDILKRQFLAERILSRLQEDDCSHVLGIYGGWGTGKTSLLELICGLNTAESSQSNKNLHVEIIDAWKYEGTGNLLIPIIVKLRELSGVKEFIQCWKVMTKRAAAFSGLSLLEAVLKNASQVGITDMDDLYEIIKGKEDKNYETVLLDWERVVDDMSNEQEAFKTIVGLANKALKSERLILCIDNLDRCTPDKVIALLESIKLFLSVANCTWVFAMDSEVIANYINRKYEGARMDGNSYLDKIIPEQYHLSLSPSIDRKNIADLLQYAAGGNILKLDERNIPQLPRILVPRRLIKSAAKFAEFKRLYAQGEARTPDALVFNLALLYHVWPDFYQRFSSASEAHIRGILDNFFPAETPLQAKPESVGAVNSSLLPLLKDYAEDQDLFYFLKTTFSEYQRSKNSFVHEIINGISGLRKVGLP